ncbi:MAG TPA: arginase family protein [Longimicrobiaceae bacterium]|nr:arginase family protein [Longimicrobiaceae bacterium]
MDLRILTVPLDAGRHEERMGRGPGALLRAGLADRLRAMGHAVEQEEVAPDEAGSAFRTEVATSFSLWARLMRSVEESRRRGEMPVVLTGNCGAALGVVGGLIAASDRPAARLGVVWMDAHGDFNTPDTSASGFLDGMSLAALVGRCWRTLTQRTPGIAIPEANVAHLGARDLDPAEEDAFAASAIARLDVRGLREGAGLTALLAELGGRVDALYLHVDLDVLDPREAPANTFVLPAGAAGEAPPGTDGLTADELVRIVGEIAAAIPVEAVTLSAYDPAADAGGRIPPIAARALQAVLAVAS